MEPEIKQLNVKAEKKWDEFVLNNNESNYCHRAGWKKIIEETYNLKSHYFYAENDQGEIVGVLPAFLIRDLFFGRRVVSLPFVPFGGVCYETDAIRAALTNEIVDYGVSENVDYCEIRSLPSQKYFERYDNTSNYVTSVLSLGNNPENTLKNFTRNKRKNIYKSERGGLSYNYYSENKAVLDDFYKIYSLNMKRLGTPQHSKLFFENILRYLHADVIAVYKDDDCYYSAIIVIFKDSMTDFTSSALLEFRKLFVTDFGVWNLILKAHEMDLKYFDFGRSVKNSENWESKRRWGAETIDLNYYYPLSKKLNFSKINPSEYTKIAKIWSVLPSGLVNIIGPKLRSRII